MDKFGGVGRGMIFDSFEEADDYVKFVSKRPTTVQVNGQWFVAHGADLFLPTEDPFED